MTDLIAEACKQSHDHGFEKGSKLGVQVSMAWLDATGNTLLAEALERASVAGDLEAFRSLPQPGEPTPAPVVTRHALLTDPAPVSPTDLGPVAPKLVSRATAPLLGFTGNCCSTCGSYQMVRNGTCEKCNECGSTTGCS